MKQPSRKNNLHDEGYIPFKLDEINKIKVLDCILILNDGSIFFGRSFGSKKTSIGEICFNTSLTGYQEIITDPSYANQIILLLSHILVILAQIILTMKVIPNLLLES
jgi:hypothetical protein